VFGTKSHRVKTLDAIAAGRLNPNDIHEASLSGLERFAMRVTEAVNIKFFLVIFTLSITWVVWDKFAPPELQFDPAPNYQFWLFLSNFVQLMLMPLILVGQNLQGRHAEARADADFATNTRALELLLDIQRRLPDARS
jgi:uncharacterized membrane protein